MNAADREIAARVLEIFADVSEEQPTMPSKLRLKAAELRRGGDDMWFKQLDRIEKILKEGIKNIMAKQEEFQAVLARIDAATDKIAADLQALADKVTNAGLSAEVESQVLESLNSAATKLEGIGKPVPPPVVPPVEG